MSDRLMPRTSTTLWPSAWTKEMDLRQPRPNDMDMGRLVVVGVDHEPIPVPAMDDDHTQP